MTDETDTTVHRGRVHADDESEAAQIVWEAHPDADKVTINGPMPDGRYEFGAWYGVEVSKGVAYKMPYVADYAHRR